ncbi:hypothetical protein [Thauera sinica]|uniref:N-acetyltransferase n=1 Tax=Thauera sinica TaxID=2665146 RepID=A0ABW1AU95_9RHOO|nr:hypothetical protein [Thauera sp. K11]ATE58596.1 hypothetical protein CCZ27_00215 [Thauera sp. K11]
MTTFALPFPPTLAYPQPPPLRRLRGALAACAAGIRRAPRMELRIDVQHPQEAIEAELDALHRRLHGADDALQRCTVLPFPFPDLLFRHREADGEHYVYVEDAARGRLAGYTVFNRLIEVDRLTDRHMRSPHSRYASAYQGRGIATAVYEWGLDTGFCLLSGARQSTGAHALWQALGRRHPLGYVAIRDKRLHYLGTEVASPLREDLNTRLILRGKGWSLERMHALGLLHADAAAANQALRRRA